MNTTLTSEKVMAFDMSQVGDISSLPETIKLMYAHVMLRGGNHYANMAAIPAEKKVEFDVIQARISALNNKDEIRLIAMATIDKLDLIESIVAAYSDFPKIRTTYNIKSPWWKSITVARGEIPVTARSKIPFISVFNDLHAAELVAVTDKADKFLVPDGYEISINQIVLKEKNRIVTTCPIFIADIIESQSDKKRLAKVCWFDSITNEWKAEIVYYSVLADANKLPHALADYGVPVNSENAKFIVAYIAAWCAVNSNWLQPKIAVDKLGWTKDNTGFIYRPQGFGSALHMMTITSTAAAKNGDAIFKAGTLEDWYSIVRRCERHPVAFLSIYAACASLFLNVIPEAEAFIFDLGCRSSSGKTTSLRLGISVYGTHADGKGLFNSWKDTMVSRAAKMGYFNNITYFCDESMHIRHTPNAAADLAYLVASGQERARGKSDGGVINAHTWRLILFSTGESPITDYFTEAGGQARVLNVKTVPFGRDENSAADADYVRRETLNHHGHFGPLVIQWLLDNQDYWPALNEQFAATKAAFEDHYAVVLKDNAVLRRQLNHAAFLSVVATCLHELIGLPKPLNYGKTTTASVNNPAITNLLVNLTRMVTTVCPHKNLFEQFRARIISKKHEFLFYDSSDSSTTKPRFAKEWLGFWRDAVNTKDSTFVYVIEYQANAILKEISGLSNNNSTLNVWCEMGLISGITKEHEEVKPGDYRVDYVLDKIHYTCIKIPVRLLFDTIS